MPSSFVTLPAKSVLTDGGKHNSAKKKYFLKLQDYYCSATTFQKEQPASHTQPANGRTVPLLHKQQLQKLSNEYL